LKYLGEKARRRCQICQLWRRRLPHSLGRRSNGGREAIVDEDPAKMTKISAMSLSAPNLEQVRRARVAAARWRGQAQRLQKEAHVFYFVFKHPGTRWYARLLAVCTAGYLFSPIQLIPSFIPVIGLLDDVAVLFLGAKLLKKITPPDVLAECRQLAAAAAIRRREEIRSTAAAVTSTVVATLWLLAAVAGSTLLASYLRH
jgi:uncharacterized membrane protein YkvA (DUF1232 family)